MKIVLLLYLSCSCYLLQAQKFVSESSKVSFFSDAPMEDIEAHNDEGTSILIADNGQVAFSIPIRGFNFEKSLMQEHFNEKYLESDKYPNSTFKGRISGYNETVSGWQKATATGNLLIHGVTREVNVEGEINFANSGCILRAKFPVKLENYKIKIPKVVFYNIAEEVEVSVEFNYKNAENVP
jgi:hypothetical protein